MSVKFVKVSRFGTLTGYSSKVVRRKISTGKWELNKHYVIAPDGEVLINLEAYNEWAQQGASSGDA